MRNRLFMVALLVICAAAARADHIVFEGTMSATMSRGQTRTFDVTVKANTPTGFSGPLTITITSSAGLNMGTTTITPAFACVKQPYLVTCSGTATLTPSQPIQISQEITVGAGALALEDWAIQLVGRGLSGVSVASGTITVKPGTPRVIATCRPRGISFVTGTGNGPDVICLKNVGDGPTTVTVRILSTPIVIQKAVGDVGDDKAVTFALAPGETASRILGLNQSEEPAVGVYIGSLEVTGEGVDPDLRDVPIALDVQPAPTSPPNPQPSATRVDVSSLATEKPTGVVTMSNAGPGDFHALVSSDALFLEPNQRTLDIPAGQSRDLGFTIDPSKAPPSSTSLTGVLKFEYLIPRSGSKMKVRPHSHAPATASTSVTILWTVKATVTDATIPPLDGFSDMIFFPGFGRTVEGNQRSVSDLFLFSKPSFIGPPRPLVNVDLYYAAQGSSTKKATLDVLIPPAVGLLGDLSGSVFGSTTTGTLVIRAPVFLTNSVGALANQINVTNPRGTLGHMIPPFLSFNGVNEFFPSLHLAGLKKDPSTTAKIYVQQLGRGASQVTIDFRNAGGSSISTTNMSLAEFSMAEIPDSMIPDGTVSVRLSHPQQATDRFQAYAVMTDRASGDSWIVADWSRVFGYSTGFPVWIPIAGALAGANGTFFRTDVTVMNTGDFPSSATLSFYDEGGQKTDRSFNVGPMQSITHSDVTTTLFGKSAPHIGYLVFTPGAGNFVVTSRNYSTAAGSAGQVGTAVPVLDRSNGALAAGRSKRIGGISDAGSVTVAARHPATQRSNFALIETQGKPATVKVTLFYTFPATKVEFTDSATASYQLGPNQFLFFPRIARELIGAEKREGLGDLRNMLVEFSVVAGEGRVIPFVSSVDNGSGDSILRVE